MSDQIDMSDLERLMLVNQYRILSLVKKGPEGESYASLADQLQRGHAWLYQPRLKQSLWPVMPEQQASFVIDVLNMYRSLTGSFKQLADKEGISEADVSFQGFDGNNESELLAFADALAEDGRYRETFSNEGCKNSHCPTIDMYERMLAVWKPMGVRGLTLSREQVLAIVAAQSYPAAG